MSMISLAIGQKIDEYTITEDPKSGNFGAVCKAKKDGLGDPFALKFLWNQGADFLARFEYENEALFTLSPHDYIVAPDTRVRIHSSVPYYGMEYVDSDLHSFMEKNQNFSEEQKIVFFKKICEAVQHAHKHGIFHRDLHWGNVLTKKLGEQISPKICDFGLAKNVNLPPLSSGGAVFCLPQVKAPEVFFDIGSGQEELHKKRDIYALGVILHYLVTGSAQKFHTIIDAAFNDFLSKKQMSAVGLQVLSGTEKDALYSEWLGYPTLSILKTLLNSSGDANLVDTRLNDTVNRLLPRMTEFDYRKRIDSIDEIFSLMEV